MSNHASQIPRVPPSFESFPPELHLELFKHLDIVSSVCLGLTCTRFYAIHSQLHGKVTLREFPFRDKVRGPLASMWTRKVVTDQHGTTREMGGLIQEWMGNQYLWDRNTNAFWGSRYLNTNPMVAQTDAVVEKRKLEWKIDKEATAAQMERLGEQLEAERAASAEKRCEQAEEAAAAQTTRVKVRKAAHAERTRSKQVRKRKQRGLKAASAVAERKRVALEEDGNVEKKRLKQRRKRERRNAKKAAVITEKKLLEKSSNKKSGYGCRKGCF